jgi:hypothetical protein
MLELGSSGSVRGVLSNEHPYRHPAPIAGAGGAFGARASLLDVGWMRDALSSDTVTRRVPSIESRGPASSSRL